MATHITYEDHDKGLRGAGMYDPLPVMTGREGMAIDKTVEFDGSAGNGATGTVSLFTVTGLVRVVLKAHVTEDLVSAGGGDIEVGTAVDTDALLANTTATDLDDGDVWHDTAPDTDIEATTVYSSFYTTGDIIATVATGDITDGTVVFTIEWSPVSDEASVTAA